MIARPVYYKQFNKQLKRYSNIKRNAKDKIENLLENPLNFGEPLKYDLEGLTSCTVRKNFIIIYVYCYECRLKGYETLNQCDDCDNTPDDIVKFLTIGPHDEAYALKKK